MEVTSFALAGLLQCGVLLVEPQRPVHGSSPKRTSPYIQSIRVERARTAGEVKPLKTYYAREFDLVSRALAAIQSMKVWTAMGGPTAEIFQNIETSKPLHDERSQRDHFWTPTLRKTGIRHRRAYQTRHTYAANSLAAGINPTYIARQMGHKNAKMLFTVYAKWIDGADRGREKAKMEQMLGNEKTAQKAV